MWAPIPITIYGWENQGRTKVVWGHKKSADSRLLVWYGIWHLRQMSCEILVQGAFGVWKGRLIATQNHSGWETTPPSSTGCCGDTLLSLTAAGQSERTIWLFGNTDVRRQFHHFLSLLAKLLSKVCYEFNNNANVEPYCWCPADFSGNELSEYFRRSGSRRLPALSHGLEPLSLPV